MAELKHLSTAWDVDRFIVLEEEKLVVIRFSAYEGGLQRLSRKKENGTLEADEDEAVEEHFRNTAIMDDTLVKVAPLVRKFCTIYAVDINEVPDFNQLYELHDPADPFAVMFFYKNKHMKVDLKTGNNNKINFPISDPEQLIIIIQEVFLAGKKKQNMVRSQLSFSNVRR